MRYQYYYDRQKIRSKYKKVSIAINYDFIKKSSMWVYAILGCSAFILTIFTIMSEALIIATGVKG